LLTPAHMNALDRLVPMPRLLERHSVDLAAEPDRVWRVARHLDFSKSPFVRALFAVRTIPGRLGGTAPVPLELTLDSMRSTPERPGFQVLEETPPRELAVGAIGKVWHLDIPFVHLADSDAFAAFHAPDQVKVAWAIQIEPLGEHDARLTVELRVDATDDEAWGKFLSYFRLVGPASRFIRHAMLRAISAELGTPESRENERPLAGDDLLADASEQVTHGITIDVSPESIWPWLVQMGCRRAGYYSHDLLDNANVPSAREIHAELQHIEVGDILPATPASDEGFEVLRIERFRALVLGGLFDVSAGMQRPFWAARPDRYWHVTWSFALERLNASSTRLHVRARAAFPTSGRLHRMWIGPVHALMERAQLRNLKERAEGRLAPDSPRDVLAGIGGAGAMAVAFFTPFLRNARSHWGLDADSAARRLPGDDLVPDPRWGWTHAVEIEAPADAVWPWVAQIGADRAGFYSYQWLENLAGCKLRNAESIHAAWTHHDGDGLVLHPDAPPLHVTTDPDRRWFVAHGPASVEARGAGKPWVEVSWLFLVEPLGSDRCRFVSRFRCASSGDLATRLQFGAALVEPVGFVMDRRMLLGVKSRAERACHEAVASPA